jgi:hypothetical protein
MTKLTRATITIEIEVPVSGTWAPPDPSVGINEGWFEDAYIDWPTLAPQTGDHARSLCRPNSGSLGGGPP